MGLLVGCAMLPLALALLVIMVSALVQEPLALVLIVGIIWVTRALWRAHRAALRRREQRS